MHKKINSPIVFEIENIRCLSFFGILLIHNINNLNYSFSGRYLLINDFLICLFKFSTISFMIVSGYLFQLNYNKYESLGFNQFVKSKFSKLIKPFLIFIIPDFFYAVIFKPYFGSCKVLFNFDFFLFNVFDFLFSSTFWFVPVIFFYFIINFFIKNVNFLSLFITFLITLFFSINIYFKFYPIPHSKTIIPFMSFFILGRYLFNKKIAFNINFYFLILIFIMSFIEFLFIEDNNTLRFFNILFSLFLVFLVFNRFREGFFLKFQNKINYYFLYLFNSKVALLIILFKYFCNIFDNLNQFQAFTINFLLFLFVLISSFIIHLFVFRNKNFISNLFYA